MFIDEKVIHKLEQAPNQRFLVSKFTVYLLKAGHRGIRSEDSMFSFLNSLDFEEFRSLRIFPKQQKLFTYEQLSHNSHGFLTPDITSGKATLSIF